MPEKDQKRQYVFEGFRLDPNRRMLFGRDGETIALKSRVFETLLHFVEHAGELLEKDALLRAVWPHTVVEENSLNQHVSALRRALGERPGDNRFIVTVPGRGYRFAAAVRSIGEGCDAVHPLAEARTERRWRAARGNVARPPRTAAYVGAALAAALVVAALLGSLELERAPAARAVRSIAVLPFENLSPGAENAHFVSGMHEELLDRLGRIQDLAVVPRASTLPHAGGPLSVQEIAAQLDAGVVLSGNIRVANDRVELAARLLHGTSGTQLWSSIYERDLSHISDIQGDIAAGIVRALGLELSPAQQATVREPPTGSPAAHALVLEARNLVLTNQSVVAREAAMAMLDRAIALDPEYAKAYGRKASLYARSISSLVPPGASADAHFAELGDRARRYAERALEIDPGDTDARDAVDELDIYAWHWSRFGRLADPRGEADARLMRLWVLSWLGRHADALLIGERVARLDPHAVDAHFGLGVAYTYAGDHTAAVGSLTRALELAPGNPLGRTWLAFNRIALGDHDAALADLGLIEQVLEADRADLLPDIAYAYGVLGRAEDARRLFGAIAAIGASSELGAGAWALTHLAVDDQAEALRYLAVGARKAREHVVDQGLHDLMILRFNLLKDPRLEQAEFREILDRIRGR
jgi:TolB-like protein/DNA-binding winged helix-turn-helix (wHTH) protein